MERGKKDEREILEVGIILQKQKQGQRKAERKKARDRYGSSSHSCGHGLEGGVESRGRVRIAPLLRSSHNSPHSNDSYRVLSLYFTSCQAFLL